MVHLGVDAVDITAFARTYDQEQWQHAFGVTSLAARVNPGEQGYRFLYEWFNGDEAPSADTIGVAQPNPALFFATMQRVGPNLTHETWRDALFDFPGTQQAISQPYLTYGDKGYWPETDYQGIDDMTILWWDPTATGPDEIRATAPACTSSSTVASATCRVTGRPRRSCSIPTVR